jgi:hypothetical protein
MNSLLNFEMFTGLSRAHMATRALELAHAEDRSGAQLDGWRSRDARMFIWRALQGVCILPPPVFGGPRSALRA